MPTSISSQQSFFNIAYWGIKKKLMLAFLLVGILPAIINTGVITVNSIEDVELKVSQSLEAINEIKLN